MHTHVTVHAGAIEAYIQAKRDTCPRWVASLTVKAHLKVWLAIFDWTRWCTHLVSLTTFKDLEYLICLCFRGVCHGIEEVDLEVDGGSRSRSYRRAVLQRDRLWWSPPRAHRQEFVRARGTIIIISHQNNITLRSPLSSVVERVTRNDEVGCSIQPAGNCLFSPLPFFTQSSFPQP
jgi:hypothetical protein